MGEAIEMVTHETITYSASGAIDPIDAIVVSPREGRKDAKPLLLLHGGPHVPVSTYWQWPLCAMACKGWSVIVPNYRGSPGFGETALQSLPGKIGAQDVEDCMAALRAAHSNGLCADPERTGVCVVGGSHGGFLGAHLAGQYPGIVRAACIRNPVCDISSMVTSSDIPEWCFKEALGDIKKFT